MQLLEVHAILLWECGCVDIYTYVVYIYVHYVYEVCVCVFLNRDYKKIRGELYDTRDTRKHEQNIKFTLKKIAHYTYFNILLRRIIYAVHDNNITNIMQYRHSTAYA